jgi:hypothetical protein
MSKKVEIDKDIILMISSSYYDLPRKTKKQEHKRIAKEITNALNEYIRVHSLKVKH